MANATQESLAESRGKVKTNKYFERKDAKNEEVDIIVSIEALYMEEHKKKKSGLRCNSKELGRKVSNKIPKEIILETLNSLSIEEA